MNAEGESLARFAQRLADTLSSPATQNVIVDVRHNDGGNSQLLAPLIETLVASESSPNDARPWIEPQLPAPLSAVAYFANQEPVLAVVLQAIASRRTRS